MSKRNRSNRSSGSSNSSSSSDSSASTTSVRKPRVHRTFIERLVAKAEDMYTTGTEIAKMIGGRGAPTDIETVAREFVPILEKYRERFFALRSSGWAPPETGAKIEIKEGDTVTIAKSAIAKYDFIEGLAEGRTKLVAVKFVPRGEGKIVDVLVKDAVTGAPYGLILKSILISA